MSGIVYFDLSHAIEVHDSIIELSGGLEGIANSGLIDSILQLIRNDTYYPNIEDKLTHLFFSVNKNHGFVDGNKRSSIALTAYFLEINGFDFLVSKFIQETENFAVDVADNLIDKELLHKIFTSILYEDDYSEALKLEIIRAKQHS